jgi:NAD(P)-dependent dehydrogenase (short-subunit alcohol dehydrogenase family)
MKVIVIGGNGTIGRPVADALSARHEVIRVGRTGGDYRADIASRDSIVRLFEWAAPFDAVVCAAGLARFRPLEELTDEDFAFTLANKLMGQVNLVRVGGQYVGDGGSFTLTGGVLSTEPVRGGAAISMVNAGLGGFARGAAIELRRGVRVNVVSPPWVSETLEEMGQDGSKGMPAAEVAAAYVESVEGRRTGETLDALDFGPRRA